MSSSPSCFIASLSNLVYRLCEFLHVRSRPQTATLLDCCQGVVNIDCCLGYLSGLRPALLSVVQSSLAREREREGEEVWQRFHRVETLSILSVSAGLQTWTVTTSTSTSTSTELYWPAHLSPHHNTELESWRPPQYGLVLSYSSFFIIMELLSALQLLSFTR